MGWATLLPTLRRRQHGSSPAGFYEWACFISQQAAEKAAKAVLQRWGAEAWGHSVVRLLEAVAGRAEGPTTSARGMRQMPQVVRKVSYDSVTVFWLDRSAALDAVPRRSQKTPWPTESN